MFKDRLARCPFDKSIQLTGNGSVAHRKCNFINDRARRGKGGGQGRRIGEGTRRRSMTQRDRPRPRLRKDITFLPPRIVPAEASRDLRRYLEL